MCYCKNIVLLENIYDLGRDYNDVKPTTLFFNCQQMPQYNKGCGGIICDTTHYFHSDKRFGGGIFHSAFLPKGQPP
jgi:hypothetical protein